MTRLVSDLLAAAAIATVLSTPVASIALAADKIASQHGHYSPAETASDAYATAGDADAAQEVDDDADDGDAQAAPIRYVGNGFGFDPDGDTNPATNTRALSRIGDAAEAAFDPPYRVVTFEGPTSSHADPIVAQYAGDFGVTFSKGLSRQICEGQRYFQYNSQCTYRRAPSGRFAAVYRNNFNRPLKISFARPVCVAAMAIYPTGGKPGEEFEIVLQGYDAAGAKLDRAPVRLRWTANTFRWRQMAGAYFTDRPAARVDVSVRSLDPAKREDVIRFLIDDVAFVADGCESELQKLADAAS